MNVSALIRRLYKSPMSKCPNVQKATYQIFGDTQWSVIQKDLITAPNNFSAVENGRTTGRSGLTGRLCTCTFKLTSFYTFYSVNF